MTSTGQDTETEIGVGFVAKTSNVEADKGK